MTTLECILLSIVIYLIIGIISIFLPIVKEMFDVKNLLPGENDDYHLLAVTYITLWPVCLIAMFLQWCEEKYNEF